MAMLVYIQECTHFARINLDENAWVILTSLPFKMAVVWVGSIMTPVLLPEKGWPELNIPNHFNQNLSFLLAGRLFRFWKCRVVVYRMY